MQDHTMEKDITLKVKVFSADTDDKFSISASKEIEFVLRNIADKGSHVALYFGKTNEFMFSTLLHVDDKGVWLEQSTDQPANQKMLQSDDFTFVGSHHKVKIQFTASTPSASEYNGRAAFFLPLPEKLLRLQRREYFRLTTPAVHPLKCVIPSVGHKASPLREVTIMDISGGGVALTCEENETELVPGETYTSCSITLPEFGTIVGTIVVRNLALLTDGEGHNYKRAGCELQNLDNPSLALLQRYVMHLQRVK